MTTPDDGRRLVDVDSLTRALIADVRRNGYIDLSVHEDPEQFRNVAESLMEMLGTPVCTDLGCRIPNCTGGHA